MTSKLFSITFATQLASCNKGYSHKYDQLCQLVTLWLLIVMLVQKSDKANHICVDNV